MAPPQKIALLGGTFDPPHNAHLFIAREAVRQCGLDQVIFIPSHQSPHKTAIPTATDEQRLDMLRLATADLPWADLSRFEIDRDALSYSWQTARHFAQLHPHDELHWLLGADQWNVLEKWARPDELARLLHFIVFARNGVKPAPHPRFRSTFLEGEMPLSATQVREKLARGESVHGLVPPPVANYIAQHRLYAPAP